MFYVRLRLAAATIIAAMALASAHAADPQVERGRYLVQIGGCTDCPTPGSFLGRPDLKRYLGGSDVGFGIPKLGTFVPPNLTPDKETGLGNWTAQQIVTAITTGVRPDGRVLALVMPWQGLSHLTRPDALAIAAFLKSVPAVRNKVPGPFGPDETPSTFVMSVLPGDVYASLPKPK